MEVYEGDKPYIFVSYSHKDKKQVEPVIEALIRHGYRVWYDKGIKYSDPWAKVIAEHVKRCYIMIPFLTKNYLESDHCETELNYAMTTVHCKCFAVYLENVSLESKADLEMYIAKYQNIMGYRLTQEQLIREIVNASVLAPCLEQKKPADRSVEELLEAYMAEREAKTAPAPQTAPAKAKTPPAAPAKKQTGGNAPAAEEKKQAAPQPAPEAQKKPAEQPVSTETHGTGALITALVFVAATIGLKIVFEKDLLESHDGLLLAARIAYPILHVLVILFPFFYGLNLWVEYTDKATQFRGGLLTAMSPLVGAGWMIWKAVAERPNSVILTVLLWIGAVVLLFISLLCFIGGCVGDTDDKKTDSAQK